MEPSEGKIGSKSPTEEAVVPTELMRHGVCVVVPTDAFVLGVCVRRQPVDAPQVLRGELVGRPQLDLRLHVGQVDPGGERARAVVALLGLLDEGV